MREEANLVIIHNFSTIVEKATSGKRDESLAYGEGSGNRPNGVFSGERRLFSRRGIEGSVQAFGALP